MTFVARSITVILDEILTEKQNQTALNDLQPSIDDSQTLLDDLTSTSKVALWRLWAFIMAVAINIHEKIYELFEAEIELRATQVPSGTPIWLQVEGLKFQFGDSLEFNGIKFVYPVIDESKQVVKLLAIVDLGFFVRFKAAKLDGAGLAIPLSGSELTSFTGYIKQIRFAGTAVTITTDPGDDLRLDYFIRYDPLLLAADGSLLEDPSTFPVIDAINGKIQSLPFDGILSLMELTDAVQLATGVIDVTLNEAAAKFGILNFLVINKEYNPDAGYLVLDEPSSTFAYSTVNV